jgi:hypothetical protein
MRWDDLFNDLEGQLERELTAEEADLRAEEERLRLARLGIRDRLMSVHAAGVADHAVRLVLRDSSLVTVTPSTFGRDWFTAELAHAGQRATECVVPLGAISSVIFSREQVYRSLTAVDSEADRSLSARLGLGFVLRDLCRRRTPVELRLPSGARNLLRSSVWCRSVRSCLCGCEVTDPGKESHPARRAKMNPARRSVRSPR